MRPGDDGPLAWRALGDLQEGGWDLEQTAADFKNRLQRIELRDAIPRAATELHVQVSLQASPHPSHRHTSE
jgi:hypothetical protein